MKSFSRSEIRERLQKRLDAKQPIFVCEVGCGIVAKFAEMYGIDMIMATSHGTYRMNGVDDAMALKPYGNSNELTLDLVNRLRFASKDTPVIAGVNPSDPWTFLEDHVATMFRMGVSGVVNAPSWGATSQSRPHNERMGFGVPKEIEYMSELKAKDIFTVCSAYTESESLRFAAVKPDMQIINLRYAVEPSTNPELYNDIDACCKYVDELYAKIKEISPETFVVVHGGPFEEFEKIKKLFEATRVDGYVGSRYFDEKMMAKYIGINQKELHAIQMK